MRFVLAVALCAGLAAGQQATEKMRRTTDAGTGVSDPVVDYYDSMSDYFRNSRRAVMAIRDKGIKDTEIPAVLLIARKSSASPNQIIAARKGGKSFEDLARQHKVEFTGNDFVREANVIFLSEYHGAKSEDIRSKLGRGASFIDLNQEYRRAGIEAKAATERARKKK